MVRSRVRRGHTPARYNNSFCFPVTGASSTFCMRLRSFAWSKDFTSLVPRPCGGGKKTDCLRMRGCPTICGGQDLYVYSPCNVGRYITCTLPHIVASSFDQGLTLTLQRVGEGRLTLKEEQISAIRHVLHML